MCKLTTPPVMLSLPDGDSGIDDANDLDEDNDGIQMQKKAQAIRIMMVHQL